MFDSRKPLFSTAYKLRSFSSLAFSFVLLLQLFSIWQHHFFVTSDGPTHVYNAKILLDFLRGAHTDFYSQLYTLNLELNPNWFSHISLMLLQIFFAPVVAEKVLISAYIIILSFSFVALMRKISKPGYAPVYVLVLPFAIQFLLYFGFYNYCFGIAFALLFVACWLSIKHKPLVLQLTILFPLAGFVFLTHIFGWFVVCVLLGGLFTGDMWPTFFKQNFAAAFQRFKSNWLGVALSGLLPFFLSLLFIKNHVVEAQYWPNTLDEMFDAFWNMAMLAPLCTAELAPVAIFKWLVVGLFGATVFRKILGLCKINITDGLLFSFGLLLVLLFVQPVELSLSGFWIPRMSWVPWLVLCLWIGTNNKSTFVLFLSSLVVVVVFVWLFFIRSPLQKNLSDAQEDYMSACEYIASNSVVLPLCYSRVGLNDTGNELSVTPWLMTHSFDYCGAEKPIINLANYEAVTPWFPVQWKKDCNPFNLMGTIEGNPPEISLTAFEKNPCGVRIDYVVTWCMNFAFKEHDAVKRTKEELQRGYELIYTSKTGRTEVWRRR
jgi:hypothetical protein